MALCQLHSQFRHLSGGRLNKVFERASHEAKKKIIENLITYCPYCQKHRQSSGHFEFTMKEDVNFNFLIFIDIIYINSNLILNVVDKGLRFQTTR